MAPASEYISKLSKEKKWYGHREGKDQHWGYEQINRSKKDRVKNIGPFTLPLESDPIKGPIFTQSSTSGPLFLYICTIFTTLAYPSFLKMEKQVPLKHG